MSVIEPFNPLEARFMARAIELAQRGLYSTDPNPRVGCVIVQKGVIVGEGWHQRAGEAHAEVMALKDAGTRSQGATAYVSLEPCSHHGKTPPCSRALIESGIHRVVAAMEDPNPKVAGSGLLELRASGIETSCGLLKASAEALNPGFCQRMRHQRPLIRSKLAMSLDGRTAMASGESRWITGEAARLDVHRLRARSSAIITGIGTVLADDPELTARLPDHQAVIEQPARIILDSKGRCPSPLKMGQGPGRKVVLTTINTHKNETPEGFEIVRLPTDQEGRLRLEAVMEWLQLQEFNEVLFEAGATLNGNLLRGGWVDEWRIYMAPIILGDQGRGLFHLPHLERMEDRFTLSLIDYRQIGRDLRLTLRAGNLFTPTS
jgi:diaminohydroxyphosphoribosylaminopyrimidine deaminase/5-amino-6-(5-phosphoribosylamino)uracil reductase